MFSNHRNFNVFLKINYYNTIFLLVSLILLFIALVVGNRYNYWNTKSRIFFFKNLVLFIFSLSFVIYLFYLYCLLHFRNIIATRALVYNDVAAAYLLSKQLDTASLIIIFLCYIVGFISIIVLGDRFWANNYPTSLLFLLFLIIINWLCISSSLFELFIYYEFLLLPSILFIYKTGYTKKSHQANIYFFIWTQLGSLFVLLGILYISSRCGTTLFNFIKIFNFTTWETYCLYLVFFFGFGVKVPLWPLHFWLIKVHVEAPSGFSIFLSGFLVKSSVYCFYKTTLLFFIPNYYLLPVVFCIIGMIDSSLKMWTQNDIKKVIAYATVQEMNAIYLLFNIGDSWSTTAGLLFLLAHGILSSLMFFLVECIYKRYNSRSILKVYGVSQLFPNLTIAIWFMLLLFFGLPGTLKFYVEIQLVTILANNDLVAAFIILFIFVFMNVIGFARCWFSILYGHPGYTKKRGSLRTDLSSEEILIIFLLSYLSVIICFFAYML